MKRDPVDISFFIARWMLTVPLALLIVFTIMLSSVVVCLQRMAFLCFTAIWPLKEFEWQNSRLKRAHHILCEPLPTPDTMQETIEREREEYS